MEYAEALNYLENYIQQFAPAGMKAKVYDFLEDLRNGNE